MKLNTPTTGDHARIARVLEAGCADGVERALSFDDGTDYTPTLPGMAADAARFVGLWGYCAPIGATEHFHCFALMPDGRVISVPQRPAGRPT